MDWSLLSAKDLSCALRAGETTSLDLTEDAIARIERDDSVINAICVPDFDRARAVARSADRAIGRRETRPRLGVPVTVKESYDVAGLVGPAFEDRTPLRLAELLEQAIGGFRAPKRRGGSQTG